MGNRGIGSPAGGRLQFLLSAVTVGELRRGAVLFPPSKKRADLERWIEQGLLARFLGRILPVDIAVAYVWGSLDAQSKLEGTQLSTVDGSIAATALKRDLIVVTSNVRDFAGTSVTVFNPWN